MASSVPSPALLNARLNSEKIQLEERLRKSDREKRDLEQTVAALVDENSTLRERESELVQQLKRYMRGNSRLSPTIAPGQTLLFADTADLISEAIEGILAPEPEPIAELSAEDSLIPDAEEPEPKRKKTADRKKRQRDESNLRREVHRIELTAEERRCPETGVELVEVDVKVTTELDYRSAELFLIEHHQVVYGLPPEVEQERKVSPLTAPAPSPAVEGVTATAALLAWLLCQKYVLHLPLYRQEDAFARLGVRLSRKTLCDWVLKAAFALHPISVAIARAIRAGPVLQLDDTPIKVKRPGPGGGKDKIRQSYLWTFANPDVTGVLFEFTIGRSTSDLAGLLKPRVEVAGVEVFVGDGYAANRSGAREAGLRVEYSCCWAHLLRKFRDALAESPRAMALFLEDISKLYEVEARATAENLGPEARLELRRQESLPIVVTLLRLTSGWRKTYSQRGKVAEAMTFARNQRHGLLQFLRDGRVPIDNNTCERAIRPVAIGRRNWLFAGSPAGAEAAATIYTLVESAKASGIDPLAYLEAALSRLGNCPASQVDELMPWRMTAELPPYRDRAAKV